MMIGAVNFEEKFASMKATLERLSKGKYREIWKVQRKMDASSTKKNILLSYRRNLTKSHVHRLTKAQAVTMTKRVQSKRGF